MIGLKWDSVCKTGPIPRLSRRFDIFPGRVSSRMCCCCSVKRVASIRRWRGWTIVCYALERDRAMGIITSEDGLGIWCTYSSNVVCFHERGRDKGQRQRYVVSFCYILLCADLSPKPLSTTASAERRCQCSMKSTLEDATHRVAKMDSGRSLETGLVGKPYMIVAQRTCRFRFYNTLPLWCPGGSFAAMKFHDTLYGARR